MSVRTGADTNGACGRSVRVMGIVNVTGDSYFGASRCIGADGELDRDLLRSRISQMILEGADIIDIGACSTRPGAAMVSEEEEWRRLAPALRLVRDEFPDLTGAASGLNGGVSGGMKPDFAAYDVATDMASASSQMPRLSIDTCWASVVRRAHEIVGPFIVNDIYAGRRDPGMLPAVAALGLPYVAMHSLDETAEISDYGGDVIAAVERYFEDFAARASAAGVCDWVLDPGFGFGKTLDQNWELLRGMDALLALGRPLLVGISRKSMIWRPLGITPEESLAATQAAHILALDRGASILRVHDVAPARHAIALWELGRVDASGGGDSSALGNEC